MRKWVIIGMVLLALGLGGTSTITADDTDLYTADVDSVQPNCLIVFDNSGSMNNEMSSLEYDPNYIYPNVSDVDRNAVYYKSGGNWDTVYRNPIGEIRCDDARNALSTYGYFNGRLNAGGHQAEAGRGEGDRSEPHQYDTRGSFRGHDLQPIRGRAHIEGD
jgi:hypothetical protein